MEMEENLSKILQFLNMTELHHAALGVDLDYVKFLITQGQNIERTAFLNFSPLHFASGRGFLNIVEYLISKGH